MKLIDLNGIWIMQQVGDSNFYNAQIPGSVVSTLLSHGMVNHPYEEDNESKIQSIFLKDYLFSREFFMQKADLEHDKLLLHCDGIDTLGVIQINGNVIGTCNNMHRTWRFDIKPYLIEGENTVTILFASPVRFVEEHPSSIGKAFTSIRKAACMFGWDWGLKLPDSGIWRDIYVEAWDGGNIEHVSICQFHKEERVELDIVSHINNWCSDTFLKVEVKSPDGDILYKVERVCNGSNERIKEEVVLHNPQLWWPVGYGGQPLYTVEVTLCKEGQILDSNIRKIGLRVIELNRDKKEDGYNYQFIVNEKRIFYRGENLIIDNAILSETDDSRWERLIANCLASNLNGIRVWGGAYYPPDIFYTLCDKYGIMIFQDFMFACSFYMISEEFLQNVKYEIEDNLKRIYHHPSIALYCGNNEIDAMYTIASANDPEAVELRNLLKARKLKEEELEMLWNLYEPLFLQLLPSLCKTYAPNTMYVHSTPSVNEPRNAKSFFDYAANGDMHYYLQYNNNAPYQNMRTIRPRFMTEIGFQSYPSIKTISTFAKKEDQTPYSSIMYSHQKCYRGNETIEIYMERDYVVPEEFNHYIYLSQLQAGEIMKYSVENFRRDNGYCSGAVLWQLNDCWPVVSWSGIDYYGRWKALQYYLKRFFAPVLVSALLEEFQVGLWVSNESISDCNGQLSWRLYCREDVVKAGQSDITSVSGSSREYISLDFSREIEDKNKGDYYLEYVFFSEGKEVGHGTVLFGLSKEFHFMKPSIMVKIEEEENFYKLYVTTDYFTKGIMLDTLEGDCIFSDNWFDLSKGECKEIIIKKTDVSGIGSMKELKENLFTLSLNDVMLNS